MSVSAVVTPEFRITCDAEGCGEFFQAAVWTDGWARGLAKDEGWSVRPNYGKGSRSAPDLCPEHKPDGAS